MQKSRSKNKHEVHRVQRKGNGYCIYCCKQWQNHEKRSMKTLRESNKHFLLSLLVGVALWLFDSFLVRYRQGNRLKRKIHINEIIPLMNQIAKVASKTFLNWKCNIFGNFRSLNHSELYRTQKAIPENRVIEWDISRLSNVSISDKTSHFIPSQYMQNKNKNNNWYG